MFKWLLIGQDSDAKSDKRRRSMRKKKPKKSLTSARRIMSSRVAIAFYKGNFSSSIKFFSAKLAVEKQNVHYLKLRCLALMATKDFVSAFDDAVKIISINPNYRKGFVLAMYAKNEIENEIRLKFESKDYQHCVSLIEKMVSMSCATEKLKLVQAKCFFHQEEFENAIQVLDDIRSKNPKNLDAALLRATSLYQSGELSACISGCAEILKINPEMKLAKEQQEKAEKMMNRLASGIKSYDRYKYKKAQKQFNAALVVDPTNKKMRSIILCNRAMTIKQLGYNKSAIDDFDEAMKLDPTNKTIYGKRAICFYRTMKFAECKSDCEEALKIQYSIDIEKLMKKALKKQKQFEKADRKKGSISEGVDLEREEKKSEERGRFKRFCSGFAYVLLDSVA